MSNPYILSLQTAGGQNTLTATFQNSVTAGNVVVATIGFQQPASPSTTGMSDSKGNAGWTKLKEFQGGASQDCISVWAVKVVTGGTSFQVTATASGGVGRPGIVIEEFPDINNALTVLATDAGSGFGARSVTTGSAPAVILSSAYQSGGGFLASDPPFVSDHLESGFCSVLTAAAEKLATGTFSNTIYVVGGSGPGASAMVALASFTSTGDMRGSQQVLETPNNVSPDMRASQIALETAINGTVIPYRASQAILESPINGLVIPYRASQVVLEVTGGLPVYRPSQIVVEIPIIPGTPPPPPGVQPLVFVAGER